ncbi:hypothetical protein ACD661_15450 [Legionella lytica]|uniref:DUF883 domain-containing protein n=1 Tax=Legionella lytica TaxID=96232 RepID=A0ABW8DEH3_9GAMM
MDWRRIKKKQHGLAVPIYNSLNIFSEIEIMDNFNHFKDEVNDNVEDMLEKAKEKTECISDAIKKQACDAQKNIESNYDDLVEQIKEKPIASILIAAGVGYLVSKFLR